MKQLLTIIILSLASNVFAGGETKQVCEDKKDKSGKVVKDKSGKPVQSCQTIKVHKKVEGEAVPEGKK